MTTEALKSPAITNLDLLSPVRAKAGAGAEGRMKSVDGYVTISASMAAGSTYRLVRIPSTAIVKVIMLESEAQGAGKIDVGLYYSDSSNDGTTVANVAATATPISQAFFASDVDLASAVTPTNITNESGTYTIDKRTQPIWQAAGLATDPGGMLDVVATVHTTAITTGTGKTMLRVEYAE